MMMILPLHKLKFFYQAVCGFCSTVAEYALKNLPLKDAVPQNAHFLDFETVRRQFFLHVEFFVNRHNTFFINYLVIGCHLSDTHEQSAVDLNKLRDEFLDYQLMGCTELPQRVWESALVAEEES